MVTSTTQKSADPRSKFVDYPRLYEGQPISQLGKRFSHFELDANRLRDLCAETQRLSIYVHIPFCRDLCSFCNCNIVVTRQYGLASQYTDLLRQEINWYGQALRNTQLALNPLQHLYIGGGTPSFLMADDLRKISSALAENFNLSTAPSRDYTIEIDPRHFDDDHARLLASLGFNRVHFGVEDFSQPVQQALNRKYSTELIQESVTAARRAGIKLVSVDLIYGLPKQTNASFQATLQQVAKFRPSRVQLRSLQHEPGLYDSLAANAVLPNLGNIKAMQEEAGRFWLDQGYVALGCGGFATPTDPASAAASQGQLYISQRGYTRQNFDGQLGFGMSALSRFGEATWQNQPSLRDYLKQINKLGHAVYRGKNLTIDDLMRREIAEKLLCGQKLVKSEFGQRWNCQFDDYFAAELDTIASVHAVPLVVSDMANFSLTQEGRWYSQELAAIFVSAAK